jgi:hypothetical protein
VSLGSLAEPSAAADCQKRPLRSRFRQRLSASDRLQTVKRFLLSLCVVLALFCASVLSYVPLVSHGIIRASGRDQHILSPAWAKVAFYPAAAIVRFRDLLRFRASFLGTWDSTDKTFPYQLTLTSLAFDTASGQQIAAGTSSYITLRDMSHHLYREPFRDPIMRVEGTDDLYVYFRHGGQLFLEFPDTALKGRMRSIPLQRVASK